MAKKPVQLDEKGYRKFGIRDKLAYAAGDLGCNMSFGLKGTVQTFWLVFMMMETGRSLCCFCWFRSGTQSMTR